MTAKTYVLNVLVGFDQWMNTLRGGYPAMTISSAAAVARANGKWWGRVMCKALDWLDPGHCHEALDNDTIRAQKSEKYMEHDNESK
jgi:hypothetical protein